jgi:hypothetical protein
LVKITLKIENWEKYNPRKDIKNPSWFAFSNRMIEDPDLYELSHGEFRAWVYCLSRASQKNSSVFEIDLRHAKRICNIDAEDFEQMIKKLDKVLVRTDGVRTAYADVRTPVHDKQTNKQTNKHTETKNEVVSDEYINTCDQVYASYQFTEGYPRNVFDEFAKEAYPLFCASDDPRKQWARFLAAYIRNAKPRIRNYMERSAVEDKPISAYMAEFFPEESNV